MLIFDMIFFCVLVLIFVVIIMRVLGFCLDKEFMEMVCYDLFDLYLMELIWLFILVVDEYMVKFLKLKNLIFKMVM